MRQAYKAYTSLTNGQTDGHGNPTPLKKRLRMPTFVMRDERVILMILALIDYIICKFAAVFLELPYIEREKERKKD